VRLEAVAAVGLYDVPHGSAGHQRRQPGHRDRQVVREPGLGQRGQEDEDEPDSHEQLLGRGIPVGHLANEDVEDPRDGDDGGELVGLGELAEGHLRDLADGGCRRCGAVS